LTIPKTLKGEVMTLKISSLIGPEGPAQKAYLEEIHPLIGSQDKRAEAINALEDFIKRYPNYATAYNNLGVMYYESGEKQKALSLYEKAVEIDDTNTAALKNLADFYLAEEGKLEEALKLYVKVLELNSEDIEVYLILGNICAQLGWLEDARLFFDKALEIEPWNLTALDNLDYLDEISKNLNQGN
jgi:tetratricopeptide (TPR) repeat protein